uniref:PepSY-like domain-containing protein n=1 Tax=Alistipes putredinis TaxID=28117 RepID=UPI003FD73408
MQVSQLPQTAQQFIKKYFGDRKVAFAKEESDFRKSYEIAFKNGDKIEFDRKGEWTDIDCKYSAVPTGIIPAPIAKYVADNYPDNKIVQIERDTRSTEVKLDNRMEIKFDKQHRVIEMDF